MTVGSENCDFMTVQGAVNYANLCGQSYNLTISVTPGEYYELVYIKNKNNLTIKGESARNTTIVYDNCEAYISGVGKGVKGKPESGDIIGSTGGRSVVLVEGCNRLTFENICLKNLHQDNQAEAIYFNSDDGRLVARNCIFSGEQDTIELKGWSYFKDCTVIGDVDFIWGYPKAALFENCEIRSCYHKSSGFIVQARCQSGDKGIVFLKCDITADSDVGKGSVYLARSGGNAAYYDNVTFAECTLGEHISSAGYYGSTVPNPDEASVNNGWKEYLSVTPSGSPVSTTSRSQYSLHLSQSEYEENYSSAAAVFADCPGGWDWIAD